MITIIGVVLIIRSITRTFSATLIKEEIKCTIATTPIPITI